MINYNLYNDIQLAAIDKISQKKNENLFSWFRKYLSLGIWPYKEKQAVVHTQKQLKNAVRIKIISTHTKSWIMHALHLISHIRSFVHFSNASLLVYFWNLPNVTDSLYATLEIIVIRITASKCPRGHCSFDCQNLNFWICALSDTNKTYLCKYIYILKFIFYIYIHKIFI